MLRVRSCPDTIRLWCIVEVFVYLYAGGTFDRVQMLSLLNGSSEQLSPRQELVAHLELFDASQAQCFKPEDKQHILSIIEAAFGGVGGFTEVVRSSFRKHLREEGEEARRAAVPEAARQPVRWAHQRVEPVRDRGAARLLEVEEEEQLRRMRGEVGAAGALLAAPLGGAWQSIAA